MNDEHHEQDGRGCRRFGLGRKARLGVAAAALIGVGAALGALATVSMTAGAHMFGAGGERPSVEQVTERVRDKTAWILGKLDATPEQERQLDTLVTTLVAQMQPLREEHLRHRRAMISELLRSDPDRGALETLRQEELRLADLASARVLDTVVQASEVLSPQQREELFEYVTRFRGHRH